MIGSLVSAIERAIAQLPEHALRRPLIASLLWTALAFVLLWFVALHLFHDVEGRFGGYGTIVEVLVYGLLAIGTWFAFASVESTVVLFYVERIASAVEARYYPDLPPAGSPHWRDLFVSGAWLFFCAVFGNLVLLPFYLVPGMNLVLFLGLNGYVLGRGYFDTVALRRMDGHAARRIWQAHRSTFIVNGAFLTFLMTVPVINLVAPVLGIAVTVHLLEGRSGAL